MTLEAPWSGNVVGGFPAGTAALFCALIPPPPPPPPCPPSLPRMWTFCGCSLANSMWGLSILCRAEGYRVPLSFVEDYVASSHHKLHTMKAMELTRALRCLSNFSYHSSDKWQQQQQGGTSMQAQQQQQQQPDLTKWLIEFQTLAGQRTFTSRWVGRRLPAPVHEAA